MRVHRNSQIDFVNAMAPFAFTNSVSLIPCHPSHLRIPFRLSHATFRIYEFRFAYPMPPFAFTNPVSLIRCRLSHLRIPFRLSHATLRIYESRFAYPMPPFAFTNPVSLIPCHPSHLRAEVELLGSSTESMGHGGKGDHGVKEEGQDLREW